MLIFFRKRLKIIILLSVIFIATLALVLYSTLGNNVNDKDEPDVVKEISIYEADLERYIPAGNIIFKNHIQESPNKNYYVFLTAKDLGMTNSIIWVIDRRSAEVSKIAESVDLRFVTTPKWSPDGSKIAYMQVYPFEIKVAVPFAKLISDGNATTVKSVVYTQKDFLEDEKKKDNKLNPAMGLAGETYLEWQDNGNIIFEDTMAIPSKFYAVSIISKTDIKAVEVEEQRINQIADDVPYFSQRDEKWGDYKLGNCEKDTIHSAGCAVTAAAMVMAYYGIKTDAEILNNDLSKSDFQGYINNCDLKWYIPVNFTEGLYLKGAYFNEEGFARLDYELDRGNPVILGFNRVPFTNIQHWVVVTHRENNNYYINDPWVTDGAQKTLKDFGGKFDHMIVYERRK